MPMATESVTLRSAETLSVQRLRLHHGLIGEQCWLQRIYKRCSIPMGIRFHHSFPTQLGQFTRWCFIHFGEGESDCSTVNWSIACDDELGLFKNLEGYNWYAVDDDGAYALLDGMYLVTKNGMSLWMFLVANL